MDLEKYWDAEKPIPPISTSDIKLYLGICKHGWDLRIPGARCPLCDNAKDPANLVCRIEELERKLLELTEDFNSYRNRNQDDHA